MFGLFVVIDGFSNLDEFQDHAKGAVDLLLLMGSYYANQSTLFLDMCGPILTVVDAMVVFALLVRNSELHPILAAGVPAWRLLVPIITQHGPGERPDVRQPGIAHSSAGRCSVARPRRPVQRSDRNRAADRPVERHLHRRPANSRSNPQLIKNAEFVLPAPEIALVADEHSRPAEALYMHGTANHAAGWLLKNVDKPFAQTGPHRRGQPAREGLGGTAEGDLHRQRSSVRPAFQPAGKLEAALDGGTDLSASQSGVRAGDGPHRADAARAAGPAAGQSARDAGLASRSFCARRAAD